MAKVSLYNTMGRKLGQIDLPKKLFGAKANPLLMAQAARIYLANQRKGLAKAKSRGELLSISTAKIWRQKGTGRARHGSKRAPIFVGGGKAHGPTGGQNYSLKLPKKMKRASLISALSAKHKLGAVWVISDLSKIERKTKSGLKVLESVLKDKVGEKIGLILSSQPDQPERSFRNLKQVSLLKLKKLNCYQVLNLRQLVFTKESLKEFIEFMLGKDKEK